MFVEGAYNAGVKIKKAIIAKKGKVADSLNEVIHLQIATNKYQLSEKYIELCLKYDVTNDNSFMVDVLADITSFEIVKTNLILGMTTELEEDNAKGTDRKCPECHSWFVNDVDGNNPEFDYCMRCRNDEI